MRAKLTMIALVAAVIGLGASLASAIDDLGPAATFCAETGCQTVKASWWAAPFGIPMSVIGVAYFGVMVALTFIEKPVLRLVLALAGGAWAVFLIVLQAAVIDAWCKLCLVADPAGIVLAIAVAAGASTLPRDKRIALLVPALGAVVAVLALWTRAPKLPPPPADTPAFVLKEQTKEAVTIVELVDFECPFCREMQKRLDEALTKTKVPVKIVRKMVPLPSHKGAVPSALAYVAVEMQGKGEQMARALFEQPPEELTPYDVERIAEKLGVDLPRYRQDIPKAIERVKADLAEAKDAGVNGLPTLFIGHARHTGAELTVDDLVREIERFDPR
ncbi:MAG: thioredoxin domain-containing protein [Deltaproteobacteria bacterium]|nr:thioredoxin domain-containing protein [Deltaproteobacteria bacterium]